ncbi:alanine racemase [Phyllobacterium sp. UNC302MFCol5.2]|uniref:alanine racemase n=1 Tax=Phyllobacterium sp. UNC302MFCol5.2 TaxID=1449065 RepID=UPI00068A308C|nr:alanine racemase [Phyllobacterium sp. UNC302MFCol5.2]
MDNDSRSAGEIERLKEWLGHSHEEKPDALCKGLPNSFNGSYADIGSQGFALGDAHLPMPCAFLRQDIVAQNRRWMSQYLSLTGVKLAPHGKTTLSPEVYLMQVEDGVWGLTAANAQQLAFFAHIGIERVILANQLIGTGNIAITLDCAEQHPTLDFYVLVDSHAGIAQLVAALKERADPRPIKLLIEIGVEKGRTGVRDLTEALALAKAIHDEPLVILAGVEGYEGIAPGQDHASRESAVVAMIDRLVEFAELCDAECLFDDNQILLTAGGTEFFDLCSRRLSSFAGSRQSQVVIRPGCYITSDSIAYTRAFQRICERSPDAAAVNQAPPKGALEVWAAVQSRPEATLAFATLGKRDVSHDWDLPVPLSWFRPGKMTSVEPIPQGHRVTRLNDQHAYLEIPRDSPLMVGDLVGFGISHACTTFDKWRQIYFVDEKHRVTGTLRTYF